MAFFKLCAAACVALAVLTPASAAAQARLPIAFISVQKIISEAADAKAAAAELAALRTARTDELNAKKKVLDTTKIELANSGGFFSTVKRVQLQEQVRKQEAELQQANQQAQAEFQERQRTLQDTIRKELNDIVMAIATQRGFQYVLNQDGSVIVGPQAADLTAEVLQRLDAASAKRASEKK
jgi:outer membrane protein